MVIQTHEMSQSQQFSQLSQRGGSTARRDDKQPSQPIPEISLRRDPSVRHVEKDKTVRSSKPCYVSDDELTPRTPRRKTWEELAWWCERW